ncbi:nucleoside triphosphate pyrophosphohydrolase family protein [Spirulina sp. 06S082]|uniref:nucleoside triphosphate pyrophosphohydrolase family protein n=1 Tax=Spirulina sp. 06S082 TaxID=3110248 RepID=UPI003A4DCD42
MNFQEYQKQAKKTDLNPRKEDKEDKGIIIPLLGLVGEAGSLLSEYKKYLRDGEAHTRFKDGISEELGDLLWYLSNIASKFDLDLEKIANDNLEKCKNRWGLQSSERVKPQTFSFDRDFPDSERLPRKVEIRITQVSEDDLVKMQAFVNKEKIGDDLTDNSYTDDGYRFHDIFHFSYAAVLGWSPVVRSNFKRKRKSDSKKDEVEDGGRAIAIEEGLSALIFSYAKDHEFLKETSVLDYQLLKTIKSMTYHLEVSKCNLSDWEIAILEGYKVWRQVKENNGGLVIIDLDSRSISYQS